MELKKICIGKFELQNSKKTEELYLSYETLGQPMEADGSNVVLVLHALTGNSNVGGEDGWWQSVTGSGKLLDTDRFCVLAFNIPGNGYDGLLWGEFYKNINTRDVAGMLLEACKGLGLEKVSRLIGGSLGACLAWELVAIAPEYFGKVFFVAGDWKCSDWLAGLSAIQMELLKDEEKGMFLSRMLSMMFFRSPEDLALKFARSYNEQKRMSNVESWLRHHGEKLEKRFSPDAYRFFTHLLLKHDCGNGRGSFETAFASAICEFIQIGIDSDIYFSAAENKETHQRLLAIGKKSDYYEIKSPHGHDAFLMEFGQITGFLKKYF